MTAYFRRVQIHITTHYNLKTPHFSTPVSSYDVHSAIPQAPPFIPPLRVLYIVDILNYSIPALDDNFHLSKIPDH
jgi:hypothetical protein